eukprot:gene49065-44584_t
MAAGWRPDAMRHDGVGCVTVLRNELVALARAPLPGITVTAADVTVWHAWIAGPERT